ncbi:MAG: response regulator [Candidatus Binatia bacterium]|jgi:DNA-binding response OmpR family regulator
MAQKRIVIVDDDPHITELICVNLDAAGYDVARAANGREAMERIDAARPHLIIVDVMMPEMDGWELCKTIKDDPEMDGIRIIMLTARATDRDRLIGRGIFGADEYVTKPFDVSALMDLCERLLHE